MPKPVDGGLPVVIYGPDGNPLMTVDSPAKISADDGAITTLGATDDDMVAAGAVGSLSAKIRRLSNDINELLTRVGEVGDNPTINTILERLKAIKEGVPLTGSLSTITQSVIPVTSESQQVLTTNPDRKYAMLINDSDTVIYIKIGAAAAPGEGIRLNPNGGVYEMSSSIGNLHTEAINAIHNSTGNKNLLIVEGV